MGSRISRFKSPRVFPARRTSHEDGLSGSFVDNLRFSFMRSHLLPTFIYLVLISLTSSEHISKSKEKKLSQGPPVKKDVRDYTDADLERLYEQWEENDEEELADDEKPPHLRQQQGIDVEELKRKVSSDCWCNYSLLSVFEP